MWYCCVVEFYLLVRCVTWSKLRIERFLKGKILPLEVCLYLRVKRVMCRFFLLTKDGGQTVCGVMTDWVWFWLYIRYGTLRHTYGQKGLDSV